MAIKTLTRPDPVMIDALKRTTDEDPQIALAARQELAVALTLPLRQGVLRGNIAAGIFQPIVSGPGAAVEFPLDLLAPGTERDHIAYTVPDQGLLPYNPVDGNYIMVPTFD